MSLAPESPLPEPPPSAEDTELLASLSVSDEFEGLPPAAKRACLKEVARRLSPALLHIVHQPTAKSRDRALAALVVSIYGPTPFGGTNSIKEVATRYGMTERNLHQLISTLRGLLQPAFPAQEFAE
jgi:hypothetical protein